MSNMTVGCHLGECADNGPTYLGKCTNLNLVQHTGVVVYMCKGADFRLAFDKGVVYLGCVDSAIVTNG